MFFLWSVMREILCTSILLVSFRLLFLNWHTPLAYMVNKSLSEGVECDWFLISINGSYLVWVRTSTWFFSVLLNLICHNKESGVIICVFLKKLRYKQLKPVLILFLLSVLKEILCTSNLLFSFRLQLLICCTQSAS